MQLSNKTLKGLQIHAGYTLIELLIVLILMGVLFSFGYTSLVDYNRQQSLIAQIRSLATDLRIAQESAQAGDKPAGCNGVLNGYQFNVISSTNYQLQAFCTGGNITTKTITLTSDFSISYPSPDPITFKSLGEGTNISSGSSASIVVTQISTNKTRTITIGANGNVQ